VPVENAIRLAREGRPGSEADLFEELRIPSVSTLPENRSDVRRNAQWLQGRLGRLGFRTELVDVTGGVHPVLAAEWLERPGAPTLTIYGHYDVQPPDPLEEWRTPPFEPTVLDGHVYARGSSDNKGNHMAAIKAAEYGLAAGPLPLNLRFLLEGEEEITGVSLPRYVRENLGRLSTDFILVWDGGFAPDGRPSLVTGLRGILYVELVATGPAVDLHSGGFGGVAPNPANTLARILGELKTREGRVTIPGFYDQVRPADAAEIESWAAAPDYDETLKRLMGARALEGEPDYSAMERQWSRPTLDINGMISGFTGEGTKTVIPARASAKVSMRLVPDQDAQRIVDTLTEYVQRLTTPGVDVEVVVHSVTPPVVSHPDEQILAAASAAFQASFGRPPALVRAGGSIPVAADFQETLKSRMLIGGLAQPGSGAHSPNEKFSLDHYHRGIELLIHLMYRLAEAG
jgi:acetylornithine deacetylase/succinyl-diaminopimelate desuccinylase-like protein